MMRYLFITTLILSIVGCNSNEQQTEFAESPETRLQWNFSKPKKLVYDFSQESVNKSKSSKDEEHEEVLVEARGNLNIRIKDDETATLSLTDVILKSIFTGTNNHRKDTMVRGMPTRVIQGMKSDGSFSESNIDVMFKTLFPLPNAVMEIGESVKLPMKIPFNANSSRLYTKGFNTLTLEGYEIFEGRECAVLKGEIKVSELDIPEEVKGDYAFSTTGEATYYFDVSEQLYVGSDIKLVMNVMMNTEKEKDNDFGMYMNMINENVFSIRLKEIEE